MPCKGLKNGKPNISFSLIGKNKATTFEGLCKDHDQEYFYDIDNYPIDIENKKQLSLLAYRSVIREVYATADAAVKAQEQYTTYADIYDIDTTEPSDLGMLAVDKMSIAYETFLYRKSYDMAFEKNDFSEISHKTIILPTSPTLACSSLITINNNTDSEEQVYCCLNIHPLSLEKTLFVLSYLSIDEVKVMKHFFPLIQSNGEYQKYQISKYVLNYCENIVISPKFYKTWSSQKKYIIVNYFIRTLQYDDLDYNNIELVLFE